jgi:hypothetical protein
MQLLNDAQGLAERMLRNLKAVSVCATATARCCGMLMCLFRVVCSPGVVQSTERFEVKLLVMNFVVRTVASFACHAAIVPSPLCVVTYALQSRLIGQHKLQVLPFYSYIGRYLNAHQASVTVILAYLAQVRAAWPLVAVTPRPVFERRQRCCCRRVTRWYRQRIFSPW